MTAELDSTTPEGTGPDPFVRQVVWLVDHVGGRDALVRATGRRVSARTVDNWLRGDYPRTSVTSAVREVDSWAREHVAGYPEAAGAPRLVHTCGPSASPAAGRSTPPGAPTRGRPGPAALAVAALLLVVVTALVSVLVTLSVVGGGPEVVAEGAPTAPTGSTEPLPPLPTRGDGTVYTQLTGSLGSNTFEDPRTLAGVNETIPALTEVDVVCRYYSPVIPSVSPDGFWYLVATEAWEGRWAPSNTFFNDDVPGELPYTSNTDFAVPVCS